MSQDTFEEQHQKIQSEREAKKQVETRTSAHYIRDSLDNQPTLKKNVLNSPANQQLLNSGSMVENESLLQALDNGHFKITKRMPERVKCPHCEKTSKTVVTHQRTRKQKTHSGLFCLGILILWPCAIKIWRDKSKMDFHHACAHCHTRIATYNPSLAYDKEQKDRKSGTLDESPIQTQKDIKRSSKSSVQVSSYDSSQRTGSLSNQQHKIRDAMSQYKTSSQSGSQHYLNQ